MASSVIGAVRVALGLDTGEFEAGVESAKRKAKSFGSDLAGELAGAFSPVALGAGTAAAAVGAFTFAMAKAAESAKYAADLTDASEKIGVTAESLQRLREAAEVSGVPLASLDEGLRSLNGALGAMQTGIGSGKVKEAFAALGITPDQLRGLNDASQLLPLIADRIQNVGTQAERVQIAKKLGLEDLVPLLMQGSEGIKGLGDEAERLGMILSDDVVARLDEMDEKMRVADERAKIASITFGASFAPALVKIKEAAAGAVNWLAQLIDQMNRVEDRADATLDRQLSNARRMLAGLKDGPGGSPQRRAIEENIARLEAEKARRAEERRVQVATPPTPAVSGGGGSGGGSGAARSRGVTGRARSRREERGVAREADVSPMDLMDYKRFADDFEDSVLDISGKLREAANIGTAQGLIAAFEENRDRIRDEYQYAIEGGLRAAIYGGGKGLMQYLADTFRESFIRNVSNVLATALEAKQSTGGGSGWFGKLASAFLGSSTGFATGGSFRVGGSGGVDSKLVSLRLTPGELVDIRRPGQMGPGGPTQIFQINAQGAVLASDLITEMQQIGVKAAMAGGTIGEARATAALQRKSRRIL